MEDSKSFHIPPPNDDLKNISEIISIVSLSDLSEEHMLWEISQISVEWIPHYIYVIEKDIGTLDRTVNHRSKANGKYTVIPYTTT